MADEIGCCRDCGEPADPRFTMDYTDVEPGAYLFWCASCGARAHVMKARIEELATRGPEFAREFAESIERAEQAAAKERGDS